MYLEQRLGFGTYEFKVTGPIDQFDKNVVLGLFDYPTADVGPDGTNEIDIEFSRWGNAANPIGNYTVWPAVAGYEPETLVFSFKLTDDRTTQRFVWTPTGVVFHSLRGFTSGNTPVFGQWTDRPASPTLHIRVEPPAGAHEPVAVPGPCAEANGRAGGDRRQRFQVHADVHGGRWV